MRDFIDIVKKSLTESPRYETNQEMLETVKEVIHKVKEFAKDKPITIELEPEIVHGNCHGIVITDLFADMPGQGVGTIVMKYLIQLADKNEINIYTDAEGPRSTEYYIKLGFERSAQYPRFHRHQLVYYPPISFEEDD